MQQRIDRGVSYLQPCPQFGGREWECVAQCCARQPMLIVPHFLHDSLNNKSKHGGSTTEASGSPPRSGEPPQSLDSGATHQPTGPSSAIPLRVYMSLQTALGLSMTLGSLRRHSFEEPRLGSSIFPSSICTIDISSWRIDPPPLSKSSLFDLLECCPGGGD